MASYTTIPATRAGAPQVVSSYTPAYTTIGGTSNIVGTRNVVAAPTMGSVLAAPTMLSGTTYSARASTPIATAAPQYQTLTTVASTAAAPATTFTAGTPVISSAARVVSAAPAYGSSMTYGSAMTIPTVTAAPMTIAAPAVYETVMPGVVETIGAPAVVETFVSPGGVVETAAALEVAEPMPEGPLVFTYWPLFAKGCASVLALQVAGFNWQLGAAPGSKGTGELWAEWLEMKPYTPWGFLPNLDIGGELIGSELAILQYLARKAGAPLAGANDLEFRISQELLHQSEELYQKLAGKCPTIMNPDKSPEDFEQLWTNGDRTTHSSQQGIPVYLTQFEEYYAKVGGRDGFFTSSGITIGEIKLYATLACLLLIDNGILNSYPNLLAFYLKWENDERIRVPAGEGPEGPQTCGLLDIAMQEWGWQQYFIAPPAPQEAPADAPQA